MNTTVDNYLLAGCGRCPLGNTPACKVHNWQQELKLLRAIVLDCGLQENIKWGVPCYTFEKSNILIVSAFKEYCCISFFKGALLQNEAGVLISPGENSQAAMLVKFTNAKEITKLVPVLKALIFEAVEIEKAGLKVTFKKINEHPVPAEFEKKLQQDAALEKAFKALTPGRQRGYLLHFSQPKQSKTREARIEKCLPQILKGKGWNE
jgi:uncharacterized protein YdeI (YjbR/CyaY-like superfamily)